jgi:hypothetical protein
MSAILGPGLLAGASGLLAKPPQNAPQSAKQDFDAFLSQQSFLSLFDRLILLRRGGFESSPHILRPPPAHVTRADK